MSEHDDIVRFGPFLLDTARRILSRGDAPVPLSSRAFEILRLLVEHRDRVMTKDEIITRVWRGLAVEENNLAVQVSALRRALGEAELDAPLILTVPGQGYRFVGRVTPSGNETPPEPEPAERALPQPAPGNVADRVIAAAAPAERPPPRRSGAIVALLGVALAALVAVIMVMKPPPPPPPAVPPPLLSIAVLPLRYLSDDPCCIYLPDAVSDDLTTALSHIPGSVVIARESADVYRGNPRPTPEIGRALNVRYLVQGSLRAVDGKLVIDASLVEAATGVSLKSEHFEVPRNHLGEATDAVVHRLASALGIKLDQIVGSAAARERGSNPDALGLFFQARSILDSSGSLASISRAQALLGTALVEQPEFADASGELAVLLGRKLTTMSDPETTEDIADLRATIANADRMAPNAPLLPAAKGLLLLIEHKWQAARVSLEAAQASEPDNVPTRNALILCLSWLGLYEQELQAIDELLRIDPLGPNTKSLFIRRGIADVMLEKTAEGLRWLNEGMAGEPDPGPNPADLTEAEYATLFRVAALQMTGDTAAAQAELQRHNQFWPNRTAWRIGAVMSREQASRHGFAGYQRALVDAGLPMRMPETADFGIPAVDHPDLDHGVFDLTPLHFAAPGPVVVTTAGLADLLAAAHPRIVNLGSGAVTLAGTIADCHFDTAVQREIESCADRLKNDRAGGAVIVMGRNAADWDGYNGALELARAGVADVRWYRGGEEAWSEAHAGGYTDTRP